MMRRQGSKKEIPKDIMSRQETVLWLGRALSTNEVTMRVVLELLDVVAFQQAVIKEFYEQSSRAGDNGQIPETSLKIEPGISEK